MLLQSWNVIYLAPLLHSRLGWHGLVTHPFWEGALQILEKDLENPTEEMSTLRQSIRQSALSTVRASTQSNLPKGNSVLGHIHDVNIGRSIIAWILFLLIIKQVSLEIVTRLCLINLKELQNINIIETATKYLTTCRTYSVIVDEYCILVIKVVWLNVYDSYL